MLSLLRWPRVHETTRLMSEIVGGPPPAGRSDRAHYLACLNQVQELRFELDPDADAPGLEFRLDGSAARFIENIMQAPAVPANAPLAGAAIDQARRGTAAAFPVLAAFDADLPRAVARLVGRFVYAHRDKSEGGSVSNALGQVWISPSPDWTPAKYAECILHECVHQALFLEEMVDPLFTFAVESRVDDQPLIVSSIRKVKRPYDLSFHALAVAVTLLEFFQAIALREAVDRHLPGALASAAEFVEQPDHLTPHGRRILDELRRSLEGVRLGSARAEQACCSAS